MPLGQEDAEIVVKDALVRESAGTATFHVYLTEALEQRVTLGFKTADGSAEAGVNYEAHDALKVSFEPGETAKTVTVPLITDDNSDTASQQEKEVTGHRDAFFLTVTEKIPGDVMIDKSYDHYKGAVAACHIIDNDRITLETEESVKQEIEGAAAYAAVPPQPGPIFLTAYIHEFHFLGIVFVGLVGLMLAIGAIKPRPKAWVQEDVKAVDMTPWKHAKWVGAVLVTLVILLYAFLADFSILS
ncbi:MAG: Calx-beta domain-containing protein [Lentisphaeria bacterium]